MVVLKLFIFVFAVDLDFSVQRRGETVKARSFAPSGPPPWWVRSVARVNKEGMSRRTGM